MNKNKSLESNTYYLSGFGISACGHNAVVEWQMRVPVYFGQPVYDLTCQCGAKAVKMTYASRKRR